MRFKKLFRSTAVAAFTFVTACDEPLPPRTFTSSARDMNRVSTDDGFRETMTVQLTDDKGAQYLVPSELDVRVTRSGKFVWTIDTSWHGRRLRLYHDDALATMTVQVDDRPPFEVKQRPDGKWAYRAEVYRDNDEDRLRLARDAADELIASRVEDPNVAAAVEVSRHARARVAAESRLFITTVVVDIVASITNQMGINIGTGDQTWY